MKYLGRTDKYQLCFFTDVFLDAREVLFFKEPVFNWNFTLEIVNNMLELPTASRQTLESWLFTSTYHLTAVNLTKVAWKKLEIPNFISSHMPDQFISMSRITPNTQVLINFSKNSFYLLPKPIRPS